MPAYNFKKEFAADVKSGKKRQTIRRRRKRWTRKGETLYLYTGQRTKRCRLLREAICLDVKYIEIGIGGIFLVDKSMGIDSPNADRFARADGFSSSRELIDWFRAAYGLPFKGVVIYWDTGRGTNG